MFDAPLGRTPFEDLGSDESGDSDTERFNEASKAKASLNTNIGSDGDSDGVNNDEDFFLRAAQQSKKSKKKTSKGGKKKKKVGGGYQVNQGGSDLMDDLTSAPPLTGKDRGKGKGPNEKADPTELEAAGMKEHGGYLGAGPPPVPLSPLPEHDGGGDDDGVVLSKKDKRKAKKKAKEVRTAEALVTQAAAAAGGDDLTCQICGKQFDTRNKLFQHIKQTGHAMLIADANNRAKEKRKKKAASTRSKNTSFRSF